MSNSGPEFTDHEGVTHRHGCDTPGWITASPPIAGITVARCSGCGAIKLGKLKS